MPLLLNRRAYEELIAGDLEWLEKQPRSLERDHIRAVLEGSAEVLYRVFDDANGTTCHSEDLWSEMRERQAEG